MDCSGWEEVIESSWSRWAKLALGCLKGGWIVSNCSASSNVITCWWTDFCRDRCHSSWARQENPRALPALNKTCELGCTGSSTKPFELSLIRSKVWRVVPQTRPTRSTAQYLLLNSIVNLLGMRRALHFRKHSTKIWARIVWPWICRTEICKLSG